MNRADIEAALRRDLGDEQAWEVYGDLLALEGDAHGELIALQQRAAASPPDSFQQRELLHRADQLFARQRRAWLGPLADAGLELRWTHGFVTEASVSREAARTVATLLELPVAALLRRLIVVRPRSVAKLVAQLGAHGRELESLELRAGEASELAPLAELARLRELSLEGVSTAQLDQLAGLPALRRLELLRFEGPLDGLRAGFPALRELALVAPRSGGGVLAALPRDALEPLAARTELRQLDLHDGGWSALEPLAGFSELRTLDLRSTNIVNLDALARLDALRELDVGGCTHISSLEPLQGLRELRQLGLRYTRVRELGPLRGHPRLESIDLSGTNIRELGPLFDCPALRRVNLEACEPGDTSPLLARGVRVLGVRPPQPSWRELAEGLLRGRD